MQAQSQRATRKQLLRPYALGLIALATTVALWGFGYKLSLYHRQASPSERLLVAKLWIEPRKASLAAAPSAKAKSHHIPDLQALSTAFQKVPNLRRVIALILPLSARGVAHFDFLIPFRSPPSHLFKLA